MTRARPSLGEVVPPTRTADASTMADVVELACLAPSVHNTQPWAWRSHGPSLVLYADRRRLLPVTDPDGRDLVLSCGAALHHAQVAALGLGWQPTTTRLPDGPACDLLARIVLTPTEVRPRHVAGLEMLRERRTDRRRFTSWPVPDGLLATLAATAEAAGSGVVATPVTDVSRRARLETLLDRAHVVQSADLHLAAERAAWVDRPGGDGVPSSVVPDRQPSGAGRRDRFRPGVLEDDETEADSADGLVVLGTAGDDPEAWLRAGEALSALWLSATSVGLTVVPLSQVIEVSETRRALQREVLGSLAVPHVVLRIGWSAVSRAALPRVPRRPLGEVLEST